MAPRGWLPSACVCVCGGGQAWCRTGKCSVLWWSYGCFSLADTPLGFVTVPLNTPSQEPRGQQHYQLNPRPGKRLPPAAALRVEVRGGRKP